MGSGDRYDLERFLTAQEGVYQRALTELRGGRKRSHWMWFIFPQIDGLGFSSTSKYYAIRSRGEADAFLHDTVLGARLTACADALLALQGKTASEVFGYPDDLKLKSSMTLFATVAGEESVFAQVLARYYGGEKDAKTLEILRRLDAASG